MDIYEIVAEVLTSRKYKNICKDTVLEIAKKEQLKHKNEKLVVKAIKNKLHQVYGAFLSERDYTKLHKNLKRLESGEDLKEICLEILSLHISTKERISFYQELYNEIFGTTEVPESIIDIACGFNPFSIPWINKIVNYLAYDIDSAIVDTINRFFQIIRYPGLAITQDVICNPVKDNADVAFVFKFLPIIEQVKRGHTQEFLKNLNVNFIVISFPLKSISMKEKGMLYHYKERFKPILAEHFIFVKEIVMRNEMFYILRKRD
jgi:16S rRNA (guanine(1405)-N(7))-methyltransferase